AFLFNHWPTTKLPPLSLHAALPISGGCGKTRLAIEAATGLLTTHPDGVWLVELAALTDAALVPSTVTAALGIGENPEHSMIQTRSEEHTSELQSPCNLVCRLLLEKK